MAQILEYLDWYKMATYYPLVLDDTDPTNVLIKELPAGTTIDMTNNGISNILPENFGLTGGVAGEVLKTITPGVVDWQPRAMVIASSYIQGFLQATQQAVTGQTIGPWNILRNVDMTYNAVTSRTSLVAGQIYMLYANIHTTAGTNALGQCTWAWTDSAGAVLAGATPVTPISASSGRFSTTGSTIVFAPAVNVDVELRCLAGSTAGSQRFQHNATNFLIMRLA